MPCPKCGRTGRCRECCCVSPDHGSLLPITQCRLCKHPVERGKSPKQTSNPRSL